MLKEIEIGCTRSSSRNCLAVGEARAASDWLANCHTVVHPLLFCPPLAKGSRYGLVKRGPLGQRALLGTGMALNSHPPLNLAVVRRRGAKLEANEVVVLEPAGCASVRLGQRSGGLLLQATRLRSGYRQLTEVQPERQRHLHVSLRSRPQEE